MLGTWRFLAINSKVNIGGNDTWADYPGIAVDEEAVYITANMFPFTSGSGGVRLWIANKGVSGGWYGGPRTPLGGLPGRDGEGHR